MRMFLHRFRLAGVCVLLLLGCGEVTKEDAKPPDSKVTETTVHDGPQVDGPAKDLKTVDLGKPDLAPSDGQAPDTTKPPDQASVDIPVPDFATPDQGPPPTPVLLYGSIGGMGPVSSGNLVLLEGSFEWGETTCVSSANLCLSGGITP